MRKIASECHIQTLIRDFTCIQFPQKNGKTVKQLDTLSLSAKRITLNATCFYDKSVARVRNKRSSLFVFIIILLPYGLLKIMIIVKILILPNLSEI